MSASVSSPGRGAVMAVGVAMLAAAAACSDSTDSVTSPSTDVVKTYNQVQRLGNPLVSEVFLLKRDHAFHGSSDPSGDVAAFAPKVKGFDGVREHSTSI